MPAILGQLMRGTAAVILIAVLFTVFGVYNTDGLPFYKGFVFWFATIATGALAGLFVVPRVVDGPGADWPVPAQVAVIAGIISFPVTLVLLLFNSGASGPPPPSAWPMQYAYVYIVSLVLTVGTFVVFRLRDSAGSEPEEGGPDPVAAFLERLPVRYRGAALYAVSSEDHYLRVHTDRGEELILMRLSDAERELDRADGLKVHRSWWVAKDGVAEAERSGGKLALVLKSGGRAPVSRSYARAVRDAGLA